MKVICFSANFCQTVQHHLQCCACTAWSFLNIFYYSGREAPRLDFGSVLRVRGANVSACVRMRYSSCARVRLLCSARWRGKFFYVLWLFYFYLFALTSYVHAIYKHIVAFRVKRTTVESIKQTNQ